MSHLIKENVILFDRMHEGLIVISEADKRLTFASKPAIQLLQVESVNTPSKTSSNPLVGDQKNQSKSSVLGDNKLDFEESSLQKALFIPTTESLEGQNSKDLSKQNDGGKISLEKIIEN